MRVINRLPLFAGAGDRGWWSRWGVGTHLVVGICIQVNLTTQRREHENGKTRWRYSLEHRNMK